MFFFVLVIKSPISGRSSITKKLSFNCYLQCASLSINKSLMRGIKERGEGAKVAQ